jgi:hypothetical protein
MSMDDLFAMLMDLPPVLAAGWGVWFAVGLGLSIWSRREKMYVWAEPEVESNVIKPPTPAERHARQQAKAPHSAGDAFGELEALLDQQTQGSHRRPGEAPAADPPAAAAPAAESPVLSEAPRLAAPQSLP